MSKKKTRDRKVIETLDLNEASNSKIPVPDSTALTADKRSIGQRVLGYLRTHLLAIGAVSMVLLLGLGVMANNGWLPHTDPLSGKKTGWFGKVLPQNAGSTWNPMAAPYTTPTPQLSKENIYAGSRQVSVVDVNANR